LGLPLNGVDLDGVKCSNAFANRRHHPNPGFHYLKQ
jgi:hypothetical protein